MGILLDDKVNFGVCSVTAYYDDEATQIAVDDATKHPAVPYNATWYDDGNYPGMSWADGNKEIVRVVAKSGNLLTLENAAGVRVAQEGTTASTKSTAGGSYKLIATVTAKDFADIEEAAIDVGSSYGWLTEYSPTGDGVADDRAAFAAAIAARTYIVIPAGTYRIATNLTIGNTITLVPLPGATIAPDAGVTVTVSGDVVAGNWAWIGGSGTVDLSSSRAVLQRKRWDGTDDDAIVVTDDIELDGADVATWTKVSSSEIAADSTGLKTCEITHGLSATPTISDIILASHVSSGLNPSDLPGGRDIYVFEVTATLIKCYVYFSDAGAAGTKITVTAWVKN